MLVSHTTLIRSAVDIEVDDGNNEVDTANYFKKWKGLNVTIHVVSIWC